MKKTDLNRIFSGFSDLTILVIGDVMVDTYMWGDVNRISPEAPVPVVSCSYQENRLGGAANVALNIKSLGARPILCGITGSDERGKMFSQLMDADNLVDDGIISADSRKTTAKTRIISNNNHLLRIDEETTDPVSSITEKEFLHNIFNIIDKTKIHAVIFEDYDKGTLTKHIIEQVVNRANTKNIPLLADPKYRNFLSYNNVTLFKPNLKELREGLKIDINKNNIKDILKAATILIDKMRINQVLVTLSDSGIFICSLNTNKHIRAETRDIIDVSGAGDTVIAIASLCLASGLNETDLATISNIAGGLVCEKVGVVPLSHKELLDECLNKVDLF